MIDAHSTVGDIAATHPLATRVFARHRIDYCCGGGKPLMDVCASRGVPVDTVLAELENELRGSQISTVRWDLEPLRSLIDHILANYHEPLRGELPRLMALATKVHRVHGDKDPERLANVERTLKALAADIDQHMQKEESVLFPMILDGQGFMADGPIAVMESEHDEVGNMLRELRALTDDFTPPAEACNSWRALWAGLADLERSLHEHIHLENNILHVRALNEM